MSIDRRNKKSKSRVSGDNVYRLASLAVRLSIVTHYRDLTFVIDRLVLDRDNASTFFASDLFRHLPSFHAAFGLVGFSKSCLLFYYTTLFSICQMTLQMSLKKVLCK